jgi:flagellar operon protein
MKVADLQINKRIYPLDPSRLQKHTGQGTEVKEQGETPAFAEVLKEKIRANTEVQFSAHAIERIQQRAATLSVDELSRLNDGVKQVQGKGAQNSLILVGDTAFVVSVKNNTVVTAIDKADSSNRVFTNIDSVAIV